LPIAPRGISGTLFPFLYLARSYVRTIRTSLATHEQQRDDVLKFRAITISRKKHHERKMGLIKWRELNSNGWREEENGFLLQHRSACVCTRGDQLSLTQA
jgi:hypothetical protein